MVSFSVARAPAPREAASYSSPSICIPDVVPLAMCFETSCLFFCFVHRFSAKNIIANHEQRVTGSQKSAEIKYKNANDLEF